jgi:hypothetical protein
MCREQHAAREVGVDGTYTEASTGYTSKHEGHDWPASWRMHTAEIELW